MSIIADVYAREILDSRGNPTIEVDVYLRMAALVGPLFLLERQQGLLKPLS